MSLFTSQDALGETALLRPEPEIITIGINRERLRVIWALSTSGIEPEAGKKLD